MSDFIPIMVAATLISFIATPISKYLAERLSFFDNPQARKVHLSPVPLLGGVAIYAGMVSAVAISVRRAYLLELAGILGGATLITGIGRGDDRYGMKPLVKMAGQAAAGLVLVGAGVQVTLFEVQALNVALTLLWVIGICNAINFMDNMDGLAAGVVTIAAAFFFIFASVEGMWLVASLAAATVGACLGFLYYNFNPASLFMGDAGSLLLGFVVAVLGIKLRFPDRPLAVTWLIPIVILGLPIFDTTLVVISRLRGRRPVYLGGKDHTSHRMVQLLGMSHRVAVVTLYAVGAGLGICALLLRDAQPNQARLIMAGLTAIGLIALIWLEWRFQPPNRNSKKST
jgi:UDP-GlcNAc:undecaprenyl-phosphate GlcNAc-1-phosphate transferase